MPEAQVDAVVREAGFSIWTELFDEQRKYPQNPDAPTIYAWKVTNRLSETVHQAERNPYYWKVDTAGNQLPYIDQIARPNLGSSREQLLLNALAGQADYIHPNPLGFSSNYSTLVQGQEQGDYEILRLYGWSNNRGAMYLNLSHPDPVLNQLFNDQDFRIALSVGMDRGQVNDLAYNGTFVPSQPSPPAVAPYDGASGAFLNWTEYDPDEANRLLDDLGLAWNSDRSQRLRPDGDPLLLVINVNNRFPGVVTMSELVKGDWEDLGIRVVLKPMGGGIWNEQYRANLHDVAMHSVNMGGRWPIIGGAREPTTVLGRNWGPNPKWGAWLTTGGSQGEEPPGPVKELFDLGNQFSAEPDPQKQVELEQRMYAIHNENLYMIGGLHQPHDHPQEWYVYIHNRLRNISQPLAPEYYYAVPSS
jgi:peptide/nickel transport system substrate-binding protein